MKRLCFLLTLALPLTAWAQSTPAQYCKSGLAKAGRGDFDGAITDYNRALAFDPKYIEAYCDRGNARLGAGDMKGALADFSAAMAIAPNDSCAYFNRGYAKSLQRDYDGAITDLDRAIELDPKMTMAFVERGKVTQAKGDFDGAIADYDRAIHTEPLLAIAYYDRGYAKGVKKDFAGAIANLNKTLALWPAYAKAYASRACVKFRQGDSAGAQADGAMAHALDPSFPADVASSDPATIFSIYSPYKGIPNSIIAAKDESIALRQDVTTSKEGSSDDFIITFTLSNCTYTNIRLPDVAGLVSDGLSTSDSVDWTGGHIHHTVAQTFNLSPARDGDFTIPAFDLRAQNGQVLHVSAIALHRAGQAVGSSLAPATASAPVTNPAPLPTLDANGLPELPPLTTLASGSFTAGTPPKSQNVSTGKPSTSKGTTPLDLYKAKVYQAVGSIWYRKIDKVKDFIDTGKVRIQYTIHADGTVQAMWLDHREKRSALDSVCLNSILEAAPFDAFSPALKQQVGEQFTDDFSFDVYGDSPAAKSGSSTLPPSLPANKPASAPPGVD